MPQYKLGGSWTDIPSSALWGTYGGTFHVVAPLSEDFTANGLPCAAHGLPRIKIRTPRMSGTGFSFWTSLFTSPTDLYTTVSIEALNPRTGVVEKWTGKLLAPVFERVAWGSNADKTLYYGVSLDISDCVSTT